MEIEVNVRANGIMQLERPGIADKIMRALQEQFPPLFKRPNVKFVINVEGTYSDIAGKDNQYGAAFGPYRVVYETSAPQAPGQVQADINSLSMQVFEKAKAR